MAEEMRALAELIARHYDPQAKAPQPLRVLPGRAICRVDRAVDPHWVLRAFQGGDADELRANLAAHAAVLLFLERQGYPTARLVRALDGSLVIAQGGWWAVVTTYVEGEPADFTPPTLRRLGAALARLHTLNVGDAATADPPVPPSVGLSPRDVPEGLALLAALDGRIPRELRSQRDAFIAALYAAQPHAELPTAVLHTDPHAGNAILLADGSLALVDWDNAGLGTAILDLGYLLITCDKGLPRLPDTHPDPARIAALVEGYASVRMPSQAELAALADAVRYGPVTRGAAHFAGAVASGAPPGAWHSWWARYRAAHETAGLAREYFARAAG